jgi:uncharacterized protein (TIGR03086 family)
MTSTFDLDRRSLAILDKIVSGVRPADLDRPTPCAGWTLADLLRHQISENHGFAVAAREGSAPDWNSGQLGDDPYRAYADSVDEFLQEFTEEAVTGKQLKIGDHGPFPGELAALMHLVDTVAHGWDLAVSLGVPYEPDPEALQVALKLAEQIPTDPAERVAQGTFAPVVEVPADAPDLDRFLGLLGRSPLS